MSDLGEMDSRMRYLYQSVPHLQEEIHSPGKLTNRSTWENILLLPENLAELHHNELNTPSAGIHYTSTGNKGKGRSLDNNESLPASPHMLNIGYGTPFHSSSQFFDKPDRQKFPLPAPSVLAGQNVLVGLGLPNTPAFQNIDNPPQKRNVLQSRHSNPFEQRNQLNVGTGAPSGSYNFPHNPDTSPDSNHSHCPTCGGGG